jgi:hypothetical protein
MTLTARQDTRPLYLYGLNVQAPNSLTYGGKSAVVGPTVYRAVVVLLHCWGRVPLDQFCEKVWGADVRPGRVSNLCHRLNSKLAAVGFPRRCGLDGDDVTLC